MSSINQDERNDNIQYVRGGLLVNPTVREATRWWQLVQGDEEALQYIEQHASVELVPTGFDALWSYDLFAFGERIGTLSKSSVQGIYHQPISELVPWLGLPEGVELYAYGKTLEKMGYAHNWVVPMGVER